MLKGMRMVAVIAATLLIGAAEAQAASKLIVNNTGVSLDVSLYPRNGTLPQDGALLPVKKHILPNASLLITYADAYPLLNKVKVLISKDGGQFWQFFRVTTAGSAIDNTLNGNDTLDVGFNSTTYSFSLVGSPTSCRAGRAGSSKC